MQGTVDRTQVVRQCCNVAGNIFVRNAVPVAGCEKVACNLAQLYASCGRVLPIARAFPSSVLQALSLPAIALGQSQNPGHGTGTFSSVASLAMSLYGASGWARQISAIASIANWRFVIFLRACWPDAEGCS